MRESVTMRRCVEDEGPRVVNSCHVGKTAPSLIRMGFDVPQEEATANFVPAAAVIRRSLALFGFTGRKGCVGGFVCRL